MGNEHSKTSKHSKKGAANGHVTITTNGVGVTANGGSSAMTSVEDSTLPGYVIVEDSLQTEVATDQTDGGPPTIQPEPDSDQCEEGDAAVVSEDLAHEQEHWRVETSTQTESIVEAHMATQTGDDQVTQATGEDSAGDTDGGMNTFNTDDGFVFRAERVEVRDISPAPEETITREACHLRDSQMCYHLPKVVADVLEAVLTVSAEDDASNETVAVMTEAAEERRLIGKLSLESELFNPDIIERGRGSSSGEVLGTTELETIPEAVLEETIATDEGVPGILADEDLTCSATHEDPPDMELQMQSLHDLGAEGDPLAVEEVLDLTSCIDMTHSDSRPSVEEIIKMFEDDNHTPKCTAGSEDSEIPQETETEITCGGGDSCMEEVIQCAAQDSGHVAEEVGDVSQASNSETIENQDTPTGTDPCEKNSGVGEGPSMEVIDELDSLLTADQTSVVPVNDEAVIKEMPEEAIETLCQALQSCGLTAEEPLTFDDLCPLQEDLISAEVFVPLTAELPSIPIPQQQEDAAAACKQDEAALQEAIELLEEMNAAPQNIEEEGSSKEEEPQGGQSGDAVADNGTIQVLENIVVSIVEAIGENLEAIENIVEELSGERAEEQGAALDNSEKSFDEGPLSNSDVSDEKNLEVQPPTESEQSPLDGVRFTTELLVLPIVAQDTNIPHPEEPTEDVQIISSADGTPVTAVELLSEDVDAVTNTDEELTTQASVRETSECVGEATEANPASSEAAEPSGHADCEENAVALVLENIVESIVEAMEENLEVIENIVEGLGGEEAGSGSVVATQEVVTPLEAATECLSNESTIINAISNSSGSELVALVKTVAECVQPIIETVMGTRMDGVTPEKAEPEVTAEEETTVATTDNTLLSVDSLLMKLRSACTSVVEESLYKLQGLEVTSLGYTITLTIHVAAKEEQ